jgi:large subunit ribosomal protein L17
MIELVDFNDMYGKDEKKKTTRRSRRAKTETAPAVEEAAPVAEAPAAVEESKEESAE